MTGGSRRWRKPLIDLTVIALFLGALSYLPPDTSLADRQKQGFVRFCVPDRDSALIRANEPGHPGPELAQMQGVAQQLKVQLRVVEIANMGRSFNPRDWQIGRGQCDILGGGLADSETNRGFLTLLPNGGRIGLIRAGGAKDLPAGATVGVFMGSAGLDRVRLSSWMRAAGWKARPLAAPSDLTAWLGQGGTAIASSLTPLPPDTPIHELPPQAGENTALAFGLWRGDVTLTRAVRQALEREMQREQIVAPAN